MSFLVSFLMLLSLMVIVVVNTMPAVSSNRNTFKDEILIGKKETLYVPLAHETKRGSEKSCYQLCREFYDFHHPGWYTETEIHNRCSKPVDPADYECAQ